MNILYICQELPSQLDSGGNIDNFNTVSTLCKLGHNVTIFSFRKNKKKSKDNLKKIGCHIGATYFNPFISSINSSHTKMHKVLLFLKNIFSFNPFSVAKFYNRQLFLEIETYLKLNKVDIIWVHNSLMSQYISSHYIPIKIIFLSDINSDFYRKMFLKDNFFGWKLFAALEWLKFNIYERKMLKKFEKIITISTGNKSVLRNLVNNKSISAYIPYIYKPIYKKKVSNKSCREILFIGNLCWYPNKDSIYWFLSKIYPILNKLDSNIHISIVGELPRNIYFPLYKNVTFYGYKKNIESFWRKADIFIVPIRYGSGIRMKILEAMRNKIPIVSTYAGAEGLNLTNKKEILFAKDEFQFVNYVKLLLEDISLQKELVQKSMHYLASNFSEYVVCKKIEKIIGS